MDFCQDRLNRQPDLTGDDPCAFRDRIETFLKAPHERSRLISGTLINQRYLVGELLIATEWDVLYTGYDLDSGLKVIIRI